MRTHRVALALVLSLVAACDDPPPAAPVQPPEPATPVAPAEPPAPDPAAGEACARVVVVAWRGAEHAADGVTRTEDEARARATELKARIDGGEDFANVARAESDAAGSGPRGGLIGTYARDLWPTAHREIRDAVFALPVDGVSDVLTTPYGFVIARRCPVEEIHTRHILVRYRGARNAPPEITRNERAARAEAERIREAATAPGADFAVIARERSEDGSAERGGDLGEVGRGLLAPEYEEAAWALTANQVSPVVRTQFGFHIIQRLE